MQISKRLMTVAHAVKSGGVVADVGCDHAFTSIYMVKNGLADHMIATDIGKLPLMRAAEHIALSGLDDKIETRLSDGLEKLEPGEVRAIIISGMGGALMAQILCAGKSVLDKTNELVLSPQSEIFLVRRFLLGNGFIIDREYMVLEQGKYYVILHAVPGNEPIYNCIEEKYGRRLIQEKNPLLKSFLEGELCRIESVLSKLSGNKLSDTTYKRKIQLCEEREMVKKVLGLF